MKFNLISGNMKIYSYNTGEELSFPHVPTGEWLYITVYEDSIIEIENYYHTSTIDIRQTSGYILLNNNLKSFEHFYNAQSIIFKCSLTGDISVLSDKL